MTGTFEKAVANAVNKIQEKQYEQWEKDAKERKTFLKRSTILIKGAFNNLQHAKEKAINPYEAREIEKEVEQLIQSIERINNITKKYE